MLAFANDTIQDLEDLRVEDEPDLEIAIPQVFTQPVLTYLSRGKLPHLEARISNLYQQHQQHAEEGLGPDYQLIVSEYQPLFTWAMSCWDFLLSTEGCRFVARIAEHKVNRRSDYRVITDKDFSRLVHRVFRQCLLDFAQDPTLPSFTQWLREQFWQRILAIYSKLNQPTDSKQRLLTPYSYLRCSPYEFLNDYHQDLVYSHLHHLPSKQAKAVHAYFLMFYTQPACAESLDCSTEECLSLLRQGMTQLLTSRRLVYCLLRQIERY